MERITHAGSVREMPDVPEDIKRVFVTSHDISPEWHIRMQAAFQKHTDNAVSKTVNLPADATEEDVKKIYDIAYELGCKGVTIYRDGSKSNQVLSTGKSGQKEKDRFGAAVKARPDILDGFTARIKTGMGKLYVHVTEYEGRPFEVFATIGKSGKSTTAKTEAIGRLISLALRSDVQVEEIIEQIRGIRGEHAVFQSGGLVYSIPDAIGRVLEERYANAGKIDKPRSGENRLKGDACPECSGKIIYEEGCLKCYSCGFSKCG